MSSTFNAISQGWANSLTGGTTMGLDGVFWCMNINGLLATISKRLPKFLCILKFFFPYQKKRDI